MSIKVEYKNNVFSLELTVERETDCSSGRAKQIIRPNDNFCRIIRPTASSDSVN